MLVGGYKDNVKKEVIEFLQHIKAIHMGHLDVEENNIRPILVDRGNALFCTVAGCLYLYLRAMGFQ